jgi:hypothetical protein
MKRTFFMSVLQYVVIILSTAVAANIMKSFAVFYFIEYCLIDSMLPGIEYKLIKRGRQ